MVCACEANAFLARIIALASPSALSKMRHRFAWCLALLALASTGAAPGPEEESRVVFVPWKMMRPGTPLPTSPLMLFWIPGSREELRRSELLTNEDLAHYATRCVAMLVVRPDDFALIDALAVDPRHATAILADGNGVVIERLEADEGPLPAAEVVRLVRDALDARSNAADALLDAAKEKAASGETDAALAIYRKVWEQRCVCPRQAKDAQRAMKKLGRR